jgi:hypothetical protein
VRWPWTRSPSSPGPERRRPGARLARRLRAGRRPGPRPEHLQLVKVAYARNLAEAEMIEGLLRQRGIPSMTQRNGGFDVPDFLAAGPRDVLVPEQEAERAREILG